MKRILATVAFCLIWTMFAGAPALAKGKSELTFSGALTNPSDGNSVWSATGEYLLPAGALMVGPAISFVDAGAFDGAAFGITAELNSGKKSGLFVGASVQKLSGDAADFADYSGQARVGIKLGGSTGFAKLYAARTWMRGADGELQAPDATQIVAGLGLRF